MTKKEIECAISVMQHYANGGKVEVISVLNNEDCWIVTNDPIFDFRTCKYRIKKEPEKKYWDCPEDVVFGAVYRQIGIKELVFPLYYTATSIGLGYYNNHNWDDIKLFEYSTDGKTWQECLKKEKD